MDDPGFAPSTIDINTQTILLHASQHDLASLKPLLRIPGNASVQDPETGYTPLHAAIAACSPDSPPAELDAAKEVVRELFLSGAIWNDLDSNNETPGCLAWRLGLKELYELCVDAGVRAELLLGLMGGYEALDDEDSEDEELDKELRDAGFEIVNEDGSAIVPGTNGHSHELAVGPAEEHEVVKRDVNSEDYLKSDLTFTENALLDEDQNGVMMAWETEIMRRTVSLLLPSPTPNTSRILNIGLGLGIIDRLFRSTTPLTHHIIEAHPSVLSAINTPSSPISDFGASWTSSAPRGGKYVVHGGKWQNVVPKLLEAGEVFDAIYFDTFGEDYGQLKMFFTEYVPGLLDENGRFGWFNGLGADRRVCYDVYTKVSELDLCDAGMDVEWTDIDVPLEEMKMEEEGEGEWKGVRRRYWTLEKYRLPICNFMG